MTIALCIASFCLGAAVGYAAIYLRAPLLRHLAGALRPYLEEQPVILRPEWEAPRRKRWQKRLPPASIQSQETIEMQRIEILS